MNQTVNVHSVPSYDELVARNGITILQAPGDLTIRDGDIAMTRWGDLMLNDETYSAVVRFVQFWRYNFPTLRTLFDMVVTSQAEEEQAQSEMDSLGSTAWQPDKGLLGGLDLAALHAINERIGAIQESRGVLAGTIILVIGRAAATLRNDLGATMDEWRAVGPLMHGRSVGEAFEAAGNNFRHADEWLVAKTPNNQQLKSVSVLSDILQEPLPANGSIRTFARDISVDILDALSHRDFVKLETAVFAFINGLIARVQSRSGCP